MGKNVAQKLIESHLMEGRMRPGAEIALKIDQTLTQDATGTMVMLEFDAMKIPRVKTELSAQYVDHNLIQVDHKNPDDHLFLRSACRKFGLWYSRPGNGVSHPVHMERFGVPGKTLLGSDSHTPAAGAMGMLAIGAGGLDVAMAMAGEPFHVKMPKIWGIRLTGELPDWVSAKDVILEMLRRHGVDGGVNRIVEYHGPGVANLSAMDRHVIANMGAELGATSTVFPSDDRVRRFLKAQGREAAWREIAADPDATYDDEDEIALDRLIPLIAKPSSPGNVVPVTEVAGKPIYQAYIGSSANPGLRDFVVPARMVKERQIPDRISLDINPTSRQVLEHLIAAGDLAAFIQAGARVHQPGCNGCIGMGQAPASGTISLRTVPRNFPGRSGTKGDQVYLCSPETATASALTGVITDPRTLEMACPRFSEPESYQVDENRIIPPPSQDKGEFDLEIGPNIQPLPPFDPLPDTLEGPVILKVGDDISTDEILPAGTRVLPYRSNVPEISKFTFEAVDETFHDRAIEYQDQGFFIVGGDNYGQGSSREHAVIAPRYLGLRAVIAKSFARIHWQNLINFGVLPLTFSEPDDASRIEQGDMLVIEGIQDALRNGTDFEAENRTKDERYPVQHALTERQVDVVLKGSLINRVREKSGGDAA